MNRISQLARLTAGYSLVSLIGPLFTILLTPLYTRVLTPNDYAMLDTLIALGMLVGGIGGLGLSSAVTVFFYDGDSTHGQRTIWHAAILGVGGSLIIALILAILAPIIAQNLLGDIHQQFLIWLIAATLPLATLAALLTSALRLSMQVAKVNLLALTSLAATIGLNILMVLILRMGVFGILLTTTITTIWQLSFGLWLFHMRASPWFTLEQRLFEGLLRAGSAALPGILALWALSYLDRLLLPTLGVGPTERGLYGIAAKLASMMAILIVPFQQAWGPLALAMRHDDDAGATYAQVLNGFAIVAFWLGLAISLFAPEILLIFTTPAYRGAAAFVAPLSYVAIANGLAVAVGIGATIAKRTDIPSMAMLVGAIVNLLLNLVLIPPLGAFGAALATMIGYLTMPVLIYSWSQRVEPLPLRLRVVLLAGGVQIGLLLIGLQISTDLAGLVIRSMLLISYPFLLAGMRLISLADLWRIVQRIIPAGAA
jgi:O-antigen/teichoic acid export membrane protein